MPKNKKVAAEATDTQTPAAEGQVTPAPAPVAEEKKAPGKIAQILVHCKAGKTNKEIAALFVQDALGNDTTENFHPTTIHIQTSKYKKANPDLYPPKAPAKTKAEKKAEAAAAKELEKLKNTQVAEQPAADLAAAPAAEA